MDVWEVEYVRVLKVLKIVSKNESPKKWKFKNEKIEMNGDEWECVSIVVILTQSGNFNTEGGNFNTFLTLFKHIFVFS